jgi:hypothetical protein
MSQTDQANGTLHYDNVIVVERYSVRFRDEGARLAHSGNPEASIRAIIESSGKKINSLHVLTRAELETVSKIFPFLKVEGSFHIVYPPNEHSGWISCCAD